MNVQLSPDRAVGELLECAETSDVVSLAPVTSALDASYSLLFKTERAGDVVEGTCHGVDTGYVTRLLEASRLQLLPPWLGGLESGSVVDRAMFGSDQQFARTAFCHHVVRPEGNFHCVIATPYVSGTERFHLVVGRPRRRREFDADSRRLLRWMLPHVAEILQLRSDLAATQRRLTRAERALDGLRTPVFIVEPDGTVVSANQAARALAVRRDAVWPDGRSRLIASQSCETERLRRAIQGTASGGRQDAVVISRGHEQRPVHLSLSLVEPVLGDERARILVVADPVDDADDQRSLDVARSYGLTRRELDVVLRLVRGSTLKVAARDLGISYNTARSYVRQVFEKTALHRQTDLLRLLATGMRPPEARD